MLRDHLRGHVLLFAKRPRPLPPGAAIRLLLVFAVLEVVLGPRLWIARYLEISIPSWARIAALLALALLLVRYAARVRLEEIGLLPWSEWTVAEKSYFVQVVLLANVIFGTLYASRLRAIAQDRSLWTTAALVLVTQLAWGFYQEVVYRGILQTALVARWGAPAGILVANALYTFGPLHWYHFEGSSPLPMFAGIFAIGLFFSLVYWRSGNLWMPAIFHGIGNFYIGGTSVILR
jgi:membrane protease YdiL (CAAX protease family)